MKRKSPMVNVRREVEEPTAKRIISATLRTKPQQPNSERIRNGDGINRIVETDQRNPAKTVPIISKSSTTTALRLVHGSKVNMPAVKNQVITVIDTNREVSNAVIEAARKRGRPAAKPIAGRQHEKNPIRIGGKATIVEEVQTPKNTVRLRQTTLTGVNQLAGSKSNAISSISKPAQTKLLLRCNYCNLRFISAVWLNKHVERSHANERENQMDYEVVYETPTASNHMGNIKKECNVIEHAQKQIETSAQLQQNLSTATQDLIKTVDYVTLGKQIKSKAGPKKQLLREKLKAQLKVQKELLEVQQEIFLKANQAQNNILQLIADLETDEGAAEDEEEDQEQQQQQQEEEEEETDEQQQEIEDEMLLQPKTETAPLYNIAPYDETIEYETEILDQDFKGLVNVADPLNNEVFVVMETEEGEEQYELFEVVEEESADPLQANNQPTENDEELCLEVFANDGDNVQYRIMDLDVPEKKTGHRRRGGRAPRNVPQRRKPGGNSLEMILSNIGPDDLLQMNSTEVADYIQLLIQSVIADADSKFSCSLCNEKFTNRYSIGPHIQRVHCKQKSKVCPHCDRAFTCTGDLTRHIRIHTGDKPFKCTFPNCSYAFRASGDLHKHLRRHNETNAEELRKYVCQTCERAFERSYDLRRHELTHAVHSGGEFEGFQCDRCPKKFVRKDQFKTHILRHSGRKPYKCPKCEKAFMDYRNCFQHVDKCKLTPEDRMYECHYCGKKLTSKNGIQTHVEKCWNANYGPEYTLL